MDRVFITNVLIENVRHLKNVEIPLSKEKLKHLIFTGKNGSGKTSVLDALSCFIDASLASDQIGNEEKYVS